MTDPTQFETFLKHFDEVKKQIKKLTVSFLHLRRDGKEPACAGKIENCFITVKRALRTLSLGSNVGIMASPDGLAFIDLDVKNGQTKLPAEKVSALIEHLDTFSVQTRNGGFQLYLINDSVTDNSHLFYEDVDVGELRARKQYVVAAGSYVPPDQNALPNATGIYTVVRNVSIKTLRPNDIPEWLRLGRGNPNNLLLPKINIGKILNSFGAGTECITPDCFVNAWGESLDQIRKRDSEHCIELDTLLNGAVQGDYNSRSEADFRVVKILWKYGFEPEIIAAILRHFRPYDKTLRDDYLIRTVSKAIEDAQARGWVRELPIATYSTPLTSIECAHVTQLPDTLPDRKYILIRGIPRSGKTHWTIQQLLKAPSGNYIANRHSITRHAVDIFKQQPSSKTAVLLMGKNRCCNEEGDRKGDCDKCPKRLVAKDDANKNSGISQAQYLWEAFCLLKEHRVLTNDEIPSHLCPYFILKFAEKKTDYCFTVPFFLVNEDQSVEIQPRDLLVLDEDPTIDYFYPKIAELAEYKSKQGLMKSARNYLAEYIPLLIKLEEHVKAKRRNQKEDHEILCLITQIRDQINPAIENLVDNPNDTVKDVLIEILNKADPTHVADDADRCRVLKRIIAYQKKIGFDSSRSLLDLFEPLSFRAHKPFIWHGRNPNVLYGVGERRIIRHPEINQAIVIGSTKGELFIDELCAGNPRDAMILDSTAFPYMENFILVRLVGDSKKDESRMINKLIHLIADQNRHRGDPVPIMTLTSSQKTQQNLWDKVQSGALMSRDDTPPQQIENWKSGKINIFYTQSTLSRGVDLPYYDALLVHSCNFAQPSWESVKQQAQADQDEDREFRARVIIERLIGDELTNSILRHSPVHGVLREDQAKIIVIKSRDWYLIEKKVRENIHTVDIEKNDLENLAAAIGEIGTRVSHLAGNEKIGFNEEYPTQVIPMKDYILLERKDKVSSAMISGKNYNDAREIFEDRFAALTLGIESRNNQFKRLSELILTYPSFQRRYKAEQRAIVKWVRRRDPSVSHQRIYRALKWMVLKGLLKSEMNSRNRRIYMRRAVVEQEKRGSIHPPAPFKQYRARGYAHERTCQMGSL